MNINNNISSINAHQQLLDNSANNIANINTNKYERINTTIVENKNNVEAVSTREQNDGQFSNTDLIKEIPNQILSYHAVGANGVAIKTQNDVNGTLLDILA